MIIYNLIKAIKFLWVLPFLLFLTNCRQPVIPTAGRSRRLWMDIV